MSTNDDTIAPATGNEKVVTPGGPRDLSHVHFVEDGVQVCNTGKQIHLIDDNGKLLSRIDLDLNPKEPRNVVSGWITYSGWTNSTGRPISMFTTTWTVPRAPTTQSGQTVFLFSGIHSSGSDDMLQPVLQWGPSFAGGGNYWTVASWYIGGARTFYTRPVKVEEGDVLIGKIVLDGQSGGKFNYTSSFTNIPNTSLTVTKIPELTWANETLEAHNITKCSDYPETKNTLMTNINLSTLSGVPALKWTGITNHSDCGQKTIITVDGATNGKVDLLYRTAGMWGRWGQHTLTHAVGTPLSAGDPTGYAGNDKQYVVYRSSDGHILQHWFDGSRHFEDLTDTAKAPAAATDPFGFIWGYDGSQRVVYCGEDRHIYELRAHGTWLVTDLTAVCRAPASASKPVGCSWERKSSMHVFFRDYNSHIHELWFNYGKWSHNSMPRVSETPVTGSPSAFAGSIDGNLNVVFRSSDGDIYVTWYNGIWHYPVKLTNVIGAVKSLGDPFGFAKASDGTQHILYRGVDEHIHELLLENSTWNHEDLTTAVRAPDAMFDPIGYTWDGDNITHAIYVSKDGHVRELWNDGSWHQSELSDMTGFASAEGKPAVWTLHKDRSEHVAFRRDGGQLQELYRYFKG